jgi:LuxR family maltose regulon positive regulatory protein
MPFAHTKIQLPKPRAAFVERGQMQPRLAAALASQRLVLLCAPAGYGKTSALAHELARLPPGHAVAWIAADAGDDLQRLLDCLVTALEPFDPPWRTAPEALVARAGRAGAEEQRAIAAELINTLDACEVAHGVIAFDDVHRVEDAAFFAFLDLLLERLSARWTVALTSRTDPPLALARLRARGELAEFRQLQLQFARDDARRLAFDAGLDGAIADRLFERTQGWPAGLRIAISAAQGAPGGRPLDTQQWQRTIDRPLFDFLVSEVLDQLRPALREFLLRTSVLADLDPARSEQVAGGGDAAALLDEVERVGLCTAVVDAPSSTLRLHDLLRDAMQTRLRIERPDLWRECLQRAAEGESDPVRRQALLLAAGRHEEAAQALLQAAPLMNLGGSAPTLLRLAAAFPPAFAAASPQLQRVLGLTKQTIWQLSDAERHYERAENLYRARGDSAGANLAAVRRAAVLVPLGRLSQAAALLDAARAAPSGDFETRMIAATAELWLALERCEFDHVAPCFDALLQLQLTTDRLEDWQTIPPPRVTAARGAAPLVARWAGEALKVAGDRPVPLRAMAQIALGWRALWLAQVDEAADLLALAEADAQWLGEYVIARSHGLALRAVLALAHGDRATALQTMRQRVAEQPAGYGDWGLWHALFAAVRVAAACADAATTREWLDRLLAMHPTLPEASERRLLPARGLQGTLAFLEGRRDEAVAHWQAALAQEEACDLMGQANELRLRLAAARLRDGAPDEAAAWIAPCLQQPEDGPRGAVFALGALAELARADWRGRLAPAAQATLVAWASALAASATATDARAAFGAAAGADSERLTARELEVLARIAAGDSNKLIARAFDLSLHTVKRHVANILGKLGVESRGQAAAWYRAQSR